MAVDSIPLLGPAVPSPMLQGGIELYLAECHHVFDDSRALPSSGTREFRGMTVLVSFSSHAADRAALRPLLHALTFARCCTAVFGAGDWPQRLIERLSATRPDFVAATIHVSNKSRVVAETLQLAVDALRRCFANALAVVVVVSAPDRRLLAVEGASGFVRGPRDTTGATARSTFLMLSALMAPRTLNGIDVADLLPVLGTCTEPAVLTEALWIPRGLPSLVHLCPEGAKELRAAGMLLSVLFIPCLSWSLLRAVRTELSRVVSSDADLRLFAPEGALAVGFTAADSGWIPTLSRPLKRSGSAPRSRSASRFTDS